MGCKCCKMIQSYLFDAAQAPPPDYVNEISSSKLGEDHTVKLKSSQSSEVLVHKNALWSEGVRRTESRGRQAGPQEPCGPRRGSLPQGDPGGGLCTKPGGTANGIGPSASPQPSRNPRPHPGHTGSWASTADSVHRAQPFLEGRDTGSQGCVLPASGETPATGKGDCGAPAEAESPVSEGQAHVLQLPAPDYPPLWDPAADSEELEEKDCLFENHAEEEPLTEIHPGVGEYELNIPFPLKRSWDSLNEAVATEVLSIYLSEKGPAHAIPVADSRSKQTDPQGSEGDSEEVGDEDQDEAVAEALAALEAATAGEDVDEAD
ncbi:PDCD10 and GCKIII kinases-associated protein 1 [Erethizon dorsatum]